MDKPAAEPIKLFVDASPLAEDKITGIPHFTAELTKALERHPDNGKKFKLVLVIAFDKRKKLSRWGYTHASVKTIPLPLRLLNLAWKHNLLPSMDMLLGKGIYLFPNYKNWPLSRYSYSLTYIHDLGFMRYPQFTQPKNLEFLKAHIQEWIARANVILTGSNHAREEIIDLLNVAPAKVTSVYHGVDHQHYYPRLAAEIKAVKTKYGIKGNYLLYIGSLEPRKNLMRLIAAYCQLPQKLCDQYSLCLVGGGGWLNDEILQAIKSAKDKGFNIVQPSQYVDDEDLPSLLSGASLLVHPALYEGFGLSPLQAMACGTPVLVANNSSLPEVVGSAGTLVDADNTKDISVKIEKVLTDEKYRSGMIKSGLGQAQKFTWGKTASELLKLVEGLNSQ